MIKIGDSIIAGITEEKTPRKERPSPDQPWMT